MLKKDAIVTVTFTVTEDRTYEDSAEVVAEELGVTLAQLSRIVSGKEIFNADDEQTENLINLSDADYSEITEMAIEETG